MNVPASLTRQRRLIDAVAMLIVSAVSFALLLYVGYGEGIRTYERFQIERLIAQGEQVRDSLSNRICGPACRSASSRASATSPSRFCRRTSQSSPSW